MSDSVFECRSLSFRYPGAASPAIDGLDVQVAGGRITAIIGPNGAGKSTLVRLLAGTLDPSAGDALFMGRSVRGWKRVDLARRLAVVAQEAPMGIPLSVTEYVSLGRNPYVSAWASLSAQDDAVVGDAIARVGLAALAERGLSDLSGGELQRAKLGRALAQEPDVLILDEPTAHLDVGHALWTFETVADLVSHGLTAVCVTHDMNLASRFASELVLVSGGRVEARGDAATVLSPDRLSRAYDCEIGVEDRGGLGHVVLPLGTRVSSPIGG
jgi:iron complex transport system ATP-binding protein